MVSLVLYRNCAHAERAANRAPEPVPLFTGGELGRTLAFANERHSPVGLRLPDPRFYWGVPDRRLPRPKKAPTRKAHRPREHARHRDVERREQAVQRMPAVLVAAPYSEEAQEWEPPPSCLLVLQCLRWSRRPLGGREKGRGGAGAGA